MGPINIQHKVKEHMPFKIKKGALHNELNIKQGQHIPEKTLEHEKSITKKTGNETLERRVIFALNFGHKK